MNATTLNNLLIRLNACAEGVEYAQGKTLKEAWDACTRPDWMLWLAGKVGADRKRLVMAACACARTVLPYVSEGDARPRIAIETAEAWCRGEVGIEEVRAAATDAAYAGYAAADAAADAAAVYAADAAAYASDATCAADAELAPLVRAHLDADYIERLLEAL